MGFLSWLLLGAICFTMSARGIAGELADPKLKVFSSLQQEMGDTMPLYPVGMQLSLTCQVAGHRDTYWYENKGDPKNPEELPSQSKSINGLRWSVFNIPHLERKDNGRELWCMKDSSTMVEEVNLNVIDQPGSVDISSSINDEVAVNAEIQCVIDGLDSHLELCWFFGELPIKCQVPETTSPSTETSVTIDVELPKILEETRSYICKPRLPPNFNTQQLTAEVLQRYDTMFSETTRRLQMVSHGAVACNNTRTQVQQDANVEEIIVAKLDPDNNKSCYKVVITEHSVPTTPSFVPSVEDRATPKSTVSPPQKRQPTISSATDDSSSARTDPSQFSVLLFLAAVLRALT